jgi:hypothetical protein
MNSTAPSDTRPAPQARLAGPLADRLGTSSSAPRVEGKLLSVSGRWLRTARLRHEWCDFLDDPAAALTALRAGRPVADVFTFVCDLGQPEPALELRREPASLAVLPVTTFKQWWEDIGFKTRNKVRKAQKTGVVLRAVELDDQFAAGVEAIYNESPVRQGRKFFHYGKKAPEIREELSSFLDRSLLIGAYHQDELVGFMKLFQGRQVLRTVHIIAKLAHRDKCVMDALIGRAVELCAERGLGYLHYGSWTDGGVGVFREKHGFRRVDVPRFFVPLTARGRLMLAMNWHRPLRERLPAPVTALMLRLRARWLAARTGAEKRPAEE